MARLASLAVQPVRIGRGLVAIRPFAAGSLVCVLQGVTKRSATILRIWSYDRRRAANAIRNGPDSYLDPGEHWGAFSNHSCRPNTRVVRERGRLVLRALRAIPAGAEVTHDYSTCLGADDVWTMRCACGEQACRRTIARADRLPPRVLRRYIRLGAVPKYILETFDAR